MKIHEYNQMMAYLTRPATPTETPDIRQPAASGGRIELANGTPQGRTTGGTFAKVYTMEQIRNLAKELNVNEFKDGIKLTPDEFRSNVTKAKSRTDFYKNQFDSFSPEKKKAYMEDFNKQLVKHQDGGYYISSDARVSNAKFVKKYFPNATGGSKIVTSINGILLKNFVNKGNVIKTSPKANANAIRVEDMKKITDPTFETSTGVQGTGGASLQHTASKNQMVKLNNLSYLEKKLNSSMSQNDKRIKIIENEVDRLIKTKPKNYVQRINDLNTEGMALASGYIKKDGKIVKGPTAGYSEFRVKDPLNEKLSYFGKDESKMLLPDRDPNMIQENADLIDKPIKDMTPEEKKRAKQIAIDKQTEFKKITKIIGASEKEISNFSKAVREIQNKVGSTPVNDFMKLGIAQSKDIGNFVTKYGLGAGKLALKGLVIATPVFAGMEVMEASEKFKKGESAGQIIADIAGNWIVPGIGKAYDAEEKNRLMKNIAKPEELEALDKYNRYRSGQKMAEGAIEFGEEEAAAQQMSKNVNTPEEQLNLFKLLEKAETTDFYNKQRLAAERAAEPLPEIEDYGMDIGDVIEEYNNGGRVGYADGPKDPKRRTVIKGLTALATLPIVGKYFKLAKVAPKVSGAVKVAIEKVSGMPNWFQPFVNKVLKMGDDVTDSAATTEREIVKRMDIEDATVDVHYNTATNDVRVEIAGGNKNALDQPFEMQYKAPEVIEETGKKTKGEFKAVESKPEAVQTGPDDYDFEAGENVTDVLDDLLSETDYLEGFATGKIRTPAEIKKAKNRTFHRKNIKEDPAQYILEEDIGNFSSPDRKNYETITSLDEIEDLLTITKTKK